MFTSYYYVSAPADVSDDSWFSSDRGIPYQAAVGLQIIHIPCGFGVLKGNILDYLRQSLSYLLVYTFQK